jgi:hypothetical protein
MFKLIGVVIVLWYTSHLFTEAFTAFDSALGATFQTLEAAALKTRENLY